MNNKGIYNNFYKTTVGRFYTAEQRMRLLRLFTLASGVKENSPEYATIFKNVNMLDKQNITNYTESKNFSIVSGIFQMDADMNSAVNALVEAFERIYRDKEEKKAIAYENKVSWLLSLRKAAPDDFDRHMELALLEYSCGKVDSAIKGLEQLTNNSSLYAMDLLAFIHMDNKDFVEAFYYYSLIIKTYTKELEMAVSSSISERLELLRRKITAEQINKIEQEVNSLPSFFAGNHQSGNTIGFRSAETRRFVYEH